MPVILLFSQCWTQIGPNFALKRPHPLWHFLLISNEIFNFNEYSVDINKVCDVIFLEIKLAEPLTRAIFGTLLG